MILYQTDELSICIYPTVKNLFWKHSLVIKYLFPRNSYACPIWIIIFDTEYTAKNQYRKLETNIPRTGIERPDSQFPHSYGFERSIYSHHRSAFSAAVNMHVDRSWEYINRSQTQECGNWDWAVQFPEKEYINGIFVAVQAQINSEPHPWKTRLILGIDHFHSMHGSLLNLECHLFILS